MIATSALADQQRAIPGQAPGAPLFTALSLDDERALGELLRFERFARDRLLPWRIRLAPLAEAGDPLAQFGLGLLYDLYPFGLGTPEEGGIALDWYGRAADQHLAVAERLLFRVYELSLLDTPRDSRRAIMFLERAFADASGGLKAEVALDFAHLYHKPVIEQPPAVAPDPERSLRYIEQALQLDPDNQSAIDWMVGIYIERGELRRAVELVERSRNSAMLEKVASGLYGTKESRFDVLNDYEACESGACAMAFRSLFPMRTVSALMRSSRTAIPRKNTSGALVLYS